MAILARPDLLRGIDLAHAARLERGDELERTRGEHAQIAALYAEHGGRIHRFLRDLLGDAALAADGTQETFVRAYKKLRDLEASADPRVVPWLFGIARNVSLELRRARARQARHLAAVGPGAEVEDAPGSHCPEAEFLGREALRVVDAALAQLSEERRAILLLRLDHGLPYVDIAKAMGLSLAKVKIEIFRAREILRLTMRDQTTESGR